MRIYSCANKKPDAMKHSEAKALQLQILNAKDTRTLIDKRNKKINTRINRLPTKQKAQLVNVLYLAVELDNELMLHAEFMNLNVTKKGPVTILGPPVEYKLIFSSLHLISGSIQKFKIMSQGFIVPLGIFCLIN